MKRKFESSHPWLTFELKLNGLSPLSMKLGEAYSKCQHLACTPLQPRLAIQLASIYLAKGINATTAIEGNTLSEDEVSQILDKNLSLPPSQEYLQNEVENVARALHSLREEVTNGKPFNLTPEWLKKQNAMILKDLALEEHITPGEFTTTSLVVGGVYRGAPPEDVPYLIETLCKWINTRLSEQDTAKLSDDYRFANTFITAVLAHLYIAWIHPFGDGNGRTSRILESAILAHSGTVPWVSTNLLSNHYNRTRSMYYRHLDRASKCGEVSEFIAYAADGFVDMIREQINEVNGMQRRIAWESFIHEQFQNKVNPPSIRQKTLLTALDGEHFTPRSGIRHLSATTAEIYANKVDKTITRDLNELKKLELIVENQKGGYRAKQELMDSFIPEKSKDHYPILSEVYTSDEITHSIH